MQSKNKKTNFFISRIFIYTYTLIHLITNIKSEIYKISTDEHYKYSYIGSKYGGTKFHILASDIDNKNFNNVVLVDNIECKIINYYTTTTQLVCIIPKGDYGERINVPVTIFTNGKKHVCKTRCIFSFLNDFSPFVSAIVPNSVYFGQSLKMIGFFAARKTKDISDIRIGGHICDSSNFQRNMRYHHYDEYVECKIHDDVEVGNHDLLLSTSSRAGFANIYESANGYDYKTSEKFNVKVHPRIDSVSNNEGFKAGQIIEIEGKGFGSEVGNVQVEYDGLKTEILRVDSNSILVEIKNDDRDKDNLDKVFLGGAGLKHNFVPNFSNINQYLKSADYPNRTNQVLNIVLTTESRPQKQNYVQRFSGLFYVPVDGKYSFRISSDDQSFAKISKNPVNFKKEYNEKDLTYICQPITSWTTYRNFFKNPTSQNCEQTLIGGKYYYILMIHREGGGDDHFSLAVSMPNDDLSKPNLQPKISEIQIVNNAILEKFNIKIWNVDGGTFKLLFEEEDEKGNIWRILSKSFKYNDSARNIRREITRKTRFHQLIVEKKSLDQNGNITEDATAARGSEWIFTFPLPRNKKALPTIISSLSGDNLQTEVNQINLPSPPLEGTFKIKIGSEETKDLPFNVNTFTMQKHLSKFTFIDKGVSVFERGNAILGKKWDIIWDSFKNEDKIPIEIVSNIKGGNVKDPATIVINNNVMFGSSSNLYYHNIPSEFLRTFNDKPQINVKVNGIYAACPERNCGYNTLDVEPVASAGYSDGIIVIELISDYQNLKVSDNYSVEFAKSNCEIYDINLPNIKCKLPTNEDGSPIVSAGEFIPKIHYKNKGYFKVVSEKYNFKETVNEISPPEGSNGGGTVLTIKGKHFSEETTININGNECEIMERSNNLIKCLTKENKTVVNLRSISGIDIGSKFTYDKSLAPQINSISQNSASPVIKTDLIINGKNFGNNINEVSVILESQDGNKNISCIIEKDKTNNFSEEMIKCYIKGGRTGKYKVKLQNKNGFSDYEIFINLGIKVSSITPLIGSKNGGTILTIIGENFSSVKNQNQIIIGKNQDMCVVTDTNKTKTMLKCRTNKPKSNTDTTIIHDVKILGRIVEIAECNGTCKFEYSDNETPVIENISPLNVINNDLITITGKGFLNNVVTIILIDLEGGENININTETRGESFVTFKMPLTDKKQFLVKIYADNKGYSNIYKDKLNNDLKILSINPNIISRGGGNLIIKGNSFLKTDKILFNKKYSCKKQKFISPNEIHCFSNRFNMIGNYEVAIQRNKKNLLCKNCNFKTFNDPRISNINAIVFNDPENILIVVNPNSFVKNNVANSSVYLYSKDNYDLKIKGSIGINNNTLNLNFENIPVGIYYLLFDIDQIGFASNHFTNHEITVNFKKEVLIDTTTSSFMGGKILEIKGMGFVENKFKELLDVRICGIKSKILSSEFTKITFETPLINSKITNEKFDISDTQKLNPERITVEGKGNKNYLNDGSIETILYGSEKCEFVYDFGKGFKANIEKISFIPGLQHDINNINGAVIEGSNDNLDYTEIFLINNAIKNWNDYPRKKDKELNYRFIRYRGGKYCRLAEFNVYGHLYLDKTIDINSFKCDVELNISGQSTKIKNQIDYRLDKTPIITNINPNVGSTQGDTLLNISGENLGTDLKVNIDNISCLIGNSTSSNVLCTTQARTEFTKNLFILRSEEGFASNKKNTFLYIDRWSDEKTWGGEVPPREGESVHVPEGQYLLVDESTPILNLIAIEGSVLFEDKKDLTLDAHYIMIRGGSMTIGTPEKRHLKKLNITLHGKKSDRHLPGMGNKLIGVVDGHLDIHGKERLPTWTLLNKTAKKGDTTIELFEKVDWEIDEVIVIAPTSKGQKEFEKRTITKISTDKKTVTLDKPLDFNHFAETLNYGGKDNEVRAEVGLLSRNIKIEANLDEESLKEKYGFHIMLKGDEDKVRGRFSYIELTKCGQAFQMGRYPIHFHMIGNVLGSYIEGVSIHNSFNRGTTIHGVHHLKISKSVYYEHLGHGIFFEDSVESHNLVENNLIMKTKKSTALLMSDLMPAGIWITRPLNYIRGNHAVSSVSFCFWYDLPNRPTGPSSSHSDVCSEGEPLGVFENNVAHGCSIGLRIYPQYKPRTKMCGMLKNYNKVNILEDNLPILAHFKNLLSYNNGTGFFTKNIGFIKLDNFSLISNNIGVTFEHPQYEIEKYSPSLVNSFIVGRSPLTELHGANTFTAVSSGDQNALLIKNVKFINLEHKFLKACSSCDSIVKTPIGMGKTFVEDLKFENSTFTSLINFENPKRGKNILYDKNGKFLQEFFGINNSPGGLLTPELPHLSIDKCTKVLNDNLCKNCLVCDESVKLKRLDISSSDSKLKGLDLNILNTNISGELTQNTNSSDFGKIKYIEATNGFKGWSVPIVCQNNYNLRWGSGVDFNKIKIKNNPDWNEENSINIKFNRISERERYDVFYTGFNISGAFKTNLPVSPLSSSPTGTNNFGDFYYEKSEKRLTMKISGKTRGEAEINGIFCDKDCKNDFEEGDEEDFFRKWSDKSNWPNEKLPVDGDNVEIKVGWKMYMDLDSPSLEYLEINGTLLAEPKREMTKLTSKNIFIKKSGKLIIGSVDDEFQNKFVIELTGKKSDKEIVLSSLINPANKSLINTGRLEIFSKTSSIGRTRLISNAIIGENEITIKDNTDWQIGYRLVIGSTSQNYKETEIVTITSIEGKLINFEPGLKYNHFGSDTIFETPQGNLDMRAEVGLISRNVIIKGSQEDNWGCKILTAGLFDVNNNYLEGLTQLKGVLIENCGQRDEETGALDFRLLKGNHGVNRIMNSSLVNLDGWGIRLSSSVNVSISDNVMYNALKYGVYLKNCENIKFYNNLLIRIINREWYQNDFEYDLAIGFYYDDDKDLKLANIKIYGNSISSSEWFAWAVPGYKCGSINDVFYNNSAHSSRAGWFGTLVHSDCQEYSKFVAYRNSEEGFVNRFMVKNLRVNNFILADNNNSIVLNGGSKKMEKNPSSEIENSSIYGKMLEEDCAFCYENTLDCDTNGVYTSIFEKENYEMKINEYILPLHNSTYSNYLWGGRQKIKEVEFKNFYQSKKCSGDKSFAIRTNNFVQDTSAYVLLENCSAFKIEKDNMFYFANHKRLMHPEFCSKRDCTGVYNILIDDINGVFSSGNPKQYFGNNKNIGKDGSCVWVNKWNGHSCNPDFMLLSILKTTSNDRGAIISPITSTLYKNNPSVSDEDKYKNIADNDGAFPVIVKKKSYHHLKFSQSFANNNLYKLDSKDNSAWGIFYVHSEDPATLVTKVNNKIITPLILEEGDQIDLETHKKQCGAYYYIPKEQKIYWIMNSNPKCLVTIHKTDSVFLTIHMEGSIAEFYENMGTAAFIDKIAALLGIHPSELKIVGLRVGSVIVDTFIEEDSRHLEKKDKIKLLRELSEKIKRDITAGSDELGFKIKDVKVDVYLPEEENYENICRFFKYNNFVLINSKAIEEIYNEDYKENEYVDVSCEDCKSTEVCAMKRNEACGLKPDLLGKEVCDQIGELDNENGMNNYLKFCPSCAKFIDYLFKK